MNEQVQSGKNIHSGRDNFKVCTGHAKIQAKAKHQALMQTLMLFGLAFYFANLILQDSLKNYSNQPKWLVVIAAAFLLILGVASGIRYVKLYLPQQALFEHRVEMPSMPEREAHQHTHSTHRHQTSTWIVPVILGVPVLLGCLMPSQPLGAAAMGGNPNSHASTFHPSGLAVPEPQAWNVKEWQLALAQGSHPQSWFEGQRVDLIGFVVRPSDIPSGDFLVGRFVMYHCAADAQGVAMLVKWKDGSEIPEDTWVRVQGTIHLEQNDGLVLSLYADSVDSTVGEPESPYLMPLLRHDQPLW